MMKRICAASFWGDAVIIVTIVQSIIALRTPNLPTVPEDKSLYEQPPHESASSDSDAEVGIFEPPRTAYRDLGPQKFPAATSLPRRPEFVRLQRIPVTGLVRGQGERLVPFRLKEPLTFFPDIATAPSNPDTGSSRGSAWSRWRSSRSNEEVASTSSVRQLKQLIRQMPTFEAAFDKSGSPDSSDLGRSSYAVRLPGNGLDSQVLALMKKKGRPFYAEGAKGKLWFFDTKDGKHFTFTDKLKRSENRVVRGIIHDEPATSRAGTLGVQAIRDAASDQGTSRQTQVGRYLPSSHWAQKISEAVKAMFRDRRSAVRYLHGMH